MRTWDVGELDLLGHWPDLLLQLLVSKTHHFPFESGRQQLLLASLTQAVDVALGREAAEAVLHEGIGASPPQHPAASLSPAQASSARHRCFYCGLTRDCSSRLNC